MTGKRAPALVVIGALLVAGGLADRRGRPQTGRRPASAGAFVMPTATPATALSSSWYCASVTAAQARAPEGVVFVGNPSSRSVSGSVTFVVGGPGGRPRRVPLRLGPRSHVVVRRGAAVPAALAGAIVEVTGGGVVVEHLVSGPEGEAVAPCASAASDRWYFAEGSTSRDATQLAVLLNPFPTDAIVDLSFSTERGRLAPQAFQGMLVKAGSVVALDIGREVLRRQSVATSVLVRRGRLVADRVQAFDGSAPGRRGLTLALGTPSPGPLWYFPENFLPRGVGERFELYNPSSQAARVDLEAVLDRGDAEPFELRVPPQGRLTVNMTSETRIPKGVGFAVTVRSVNGVGVVAERAVGTTPSSSRRGVAATLGSRRAAVRWAFATGPRADTTDQSLVVLNPGARAVRVRVHLLASGQSRPLDGGGGGGVVGPGRRTAFRLGARPAGSADVLLLEADGPVVVERDLYRTRGPGISMSLGIPLV